MPEDKLTLLEQDILAAEVGNLPFVLYYRPGQTRPYECRLDRKHVHVNDTRQGLYVASARGPARALSVCVQMVADDDYTVEG